MKHVSPWSDQALRVFLKSAQCRQLVENNDLTVLHCKRQDRAFRPVQRFSNGCRHYHSAVWAYRCPVLTK